MRGYRAIAIPGTLFWAIAVASGASSWVSFDEVREVHGKSTSYPTSIACALEWWIHHNKYVIIRDFCSGSCKFSRSDDRRVADLPALDAMLQLASAPPADTLHTKSL